MKYLLLLCLSVITLCTFAQFKNDHIAFSTVYINDLCDSLKRFPERLILDVRTRGEFADTSSQASLNIGRLKGAVNIDVNEVKNRLAEILAWKNKPVFVICSHSQRSRVCSKMLSDSGFTHVVNVNGAMTEFNLEKNDAIPCADDLYETGNAFRLLSPKAVAQLLTKEPNVYIIDVRTDSSFRGIARDPGLNALGRFKKSVNIPLSQLIISLDKIPRDQTILVVADYGRDTNLGAKLLTDKGYTKVVAAFNGLNEWLSAPIKELPNREKFWENPNRFGLLNAEEMNDWMKTNPSTLLLDVRTAAEFNNEVKDRTWLNRGHIRNALNIPAGELDKRKSELEDFRNKDIIVYAFNANTEAFQSAQWLVEHGFSKVKLLTGGLWGVRSRAANIKGLNYLMPWVVDVPEENQ
jgi:rhodanese-related sulfurtransferase